MVKSARVLYFFSISYSCDPGPNMTIYYKNATKHFLITL